MSTPLDRTGAPAQRCTLTGTPAHVLGGCRANALASDRIYAHIAELPSVLSAADSAPAVEAEA